MLRFVIRTFKLLKWQFLAQHIWSNAWNQDRMEIIMTRHDRRFESWCIISEQWYTFTSLSNTKNILKIHLLAFIMDNLHDFYKGYVSYWPSNGILESNNYNTNNIIFVSANQDHWKNLNEIISWRCNFWKFPFIYLIFGQLYITFWYFIHLLTC